MLHFAVLCYAVLLCSISLQVFCSKIGLAPYIEVAMYHKKAKALMVTDAVVYIPEDPPEASSHSLLPCMSMSDHVSEHEQNITLFCMYRNNKTAVFGHFKTTLSCLALLHICILHACVRLYIACMCKDLSSQLCCAQSSWD